MSKLPVKINDVKRKKRFGIAVSSFDELRTEGCKCLNIKVSKLNRICLEQDGTILEESYFTFLKPFTVLVFVMKGEKWKGYEHLVCEALDKMWRSSQKKLIALVLERFMSAEPDREEKQRVLTSILDKKVKGEEVVEKREEVVEKREEVVEKREEVVEKREEDPEWFQGIEKRFHTKDAAMRENARRRIRHYFFKSREQLLQSINKADCDEGDDEDDDDNDVTEREECIRNMFAKFQTMLKKNEFNGHYFSRSTNLESLCDRSGLFGCQGEFSATKCSGLHQINPYENRESRIIFSTWNLDHIIERSREVVPSMLAAVKHYGGSSRKKKEINWLYFYSLLFTRDNLKLVHIACHRKDAHLGYACNEEEIYLSSK